ncbi:MAG TPA: LuxR C-terminal-related transcriptional regulator [Solirubrobacteraceae bacterium]|nr:LuxR C-terminal-related transcriptional regulator [Solirubrobacteraceae bacterium]
METIAAVSEHPDDFLSHPLFVRSRNPMLVADDERRLVEANSAACLFLRQPLDAVRKLRIDDLTMHDTRPRLDAMWSEFLKGTSRARTTPWSLQMPDGSTVPIDLSSTPNYRPGLHLAVILPRAAHALDERLDSAAAPTHRVLTPREREALTLVALGHTGIEIASQLFLSPATVQTHVANALMKLGARNRAHGITLALAANELGLGTQP